MLESAILLHNFLPQNNLISFSDLSPEKATRQTVSFSLDREKIRAKEGLIKTQDHKKKKRKKSKLYFPNKFAWHLGKKRKERKI